MPLVMCCVILGRKDPVRGNDLFLSLDYGLQVVASEQLAGRRGAIVAMNPKTGEIRGAGFPAQF